MTLTDAALVELIGVVGDVHCGRIMASEHEIEVLIWALEVLATLGEDENARR